MTIESLSTIGYDDGDIDTNVSANPHIGELIASPLFASPDVARRHVGDDRGGVRRPACSPAATRTTSVARPR